MAVDMSVPVTYALGMDFFSTKQSTLYCEEVPLAELALQFGTPLYVYSYATLERHFKVYDEALEGKDHLICYAVKANSNVALLRAMARWGGGADVVSAGELYRCLEAGIPADRIVYSGVGKTLQEIEYALRRKVFMLHIESASELRQVSHVAEALGVRANVSFRLNPDVDPKTHPYISTGLKENKFGLRRSELKELFTRVKQDPNLNAKGISFHIGSQLTELSPLQESLKKALEFIDELKALGVSIDVLDIGGGLGVRYRDENPPSPKSYGDMIRNVVGDRALRILIEPGRSIVANAGVLLTKVIYVKEGSEKTFVVVDAGMNDLLRPALYDAEHDIVPVASRNAPVKVVDIVGPICESSDFLAKNRTIRELDEGELLCVRTTGAYGFSMASQYNSRPRAAEVLVQGANVDLIRVRDSFEDLIRQEKIPEWLRGGE